MLGCTRFAPLSSHHVRVGAAHRTSGALDISFGRSSIGDKRLAWPLVDPGRARSLSTRYVAASVAAASRPLIFREGLAIRVAGALPMNGGSSSSAAPCVASFRLDGLELVEFDIDCGDGASLIAYSHEVSRFRDQHAILEHRWRARDSSLFRYLNRTREICGYLLSGTIDARRLGMALSLSRASVRTDLGIENPVIDHYVSVAVDCGAFGAKSAGARPTGGVMFAICPNGSVEAVVEAISRLGAVVGVARLATTSQVAPL
jgi:galactokinase